MAKHNDHKLIYCLIILTYVFSGSSGFSQSSGRKDNLRNSKEQITAPFIDSLNKTAFSVFRTDPTKTRILAKQSLEYARAIEYKPGEGKALNYLGMTCHMTGLYDSAAYYYEKSLEVFDRLNDTLYTGKIYNNLAFLYSDQEYHNLSLEYNFKSLEIAESLKDTMGLLHSYNNIGVSYETMKKYSQAMAYFQKMIGLLKASDQHREEYYNALANIGLLHIYQNQYDSAASCLNQSLRFFKTVEDNYGMGNTYSVLGFLNIQAGKPDLAIQAIEASDEYARILDDKKTLANNRFYIAETYYLLRRFNDSKVHFKATLDLARRNRYLKLEMDSYFYLARIDSVNKDFIGNLENYRAGVSLRDSLNSITAQKQIAELGIQYESNRKDHEINLLRRDNDIQDLKVKKHRTQRNLLLVILFVVACFVVFALINRRRIRMANDILARQNAEIAIKNAKLIEHDRHLARMVEERTKELVKARDKAEESDRLKSAFLANMSHEIRTPLNGILGFMELLQEKDLTAEDQENYFNIISKSSDRLLNTINNIVDISKIESGQIQLDIAEFDVTERLKFFCDFFSPEARRKGLKFTLHEGSIGESVLIRSDRDKLDVIISNLIKNAIKYTRQGFIEMKYNILDGFFVFCIKDTGIGIPPHRLHTIFDRFVQLNEKQNSSLEGSGLGLAIIKAYVNMLGGTIQVESEENKGSAFSVRIPLGLDYVME